MIKLIDGNQIFDPPEKITITNPSEDILIKYGGCKYYTEEEQPSYNKETEYLELQVQIDGDNATGTWVIKNIDIDKR